MIDPILYHARYAMLGLPRVRHRPAERRIAPPRRK